MGPAPREPMKQQVNRCLLRLSDRDTEAMAAAELNAIARGLEADELPGFVAAVSDARPTDRTPLRRHTLRLLALVAGEHPRDAVAPLVPRLVAAALRRVRDPDSSVRAALVDAARAAAGAAASPPAALGPLADALLHEQDQCAQLAAALAAAAAVQASAPTDDLASYLRALLPRLLKLLRSAAFKAKPALISLVGAASAASGGGAASTAVPCLRDALTGDDWAARKAAAEALALLANEHGDDLISHKSSCIAVFEAKRFDKVKIVRESMNRMIEAWREIPDVNEEVCSSDAPPASQARSSLTETASDRRYPADSLGSNSVPSVTRRNSWPASRSPPRDASQNASNRKTSPSSTSNRKNSLPSNPNADQTRNDDYKVDVTVAPDATPIKMVTEEKLLKEGNVRERLEARRMLFQKTGEKGYKKLAGLKSGSRVVPHNGDGDLEETAKTEDGPEEFQSAHRDEDLSKIRMQLVQIQNQQTSLLNLLQKFMGSSQNGIRSLETRVNGLEMALDEISRDLAASSGRIPNSEPDTNACCILSPKFWRRHDGGRYTSRYSVSDIPNYSEESKTSYKWERQKFGVQGGFVTNPLAEPNTSSVRSTAVTQEGRRRDSAQYK
ncbi:TORTIFOLIA1-like protein 3 [Phragmites australis]|uniref:TORTIFOLIA1-like protein 3 n=1 Tax=Phragmites australis TaxID=29695 RepID=UPI002D7765AE|nr:TORTIFOLIA1-like protein 3 [Phragmites australis]